MSVRLNVPRGKGAVERRFQALTLASATPRYLEALGARLVRGRWLTEADVSGGEPVVLISQSAAKHLDIGIDPVGRPLLFPLPPALAGRSRKPKVVGIVADIQYTGLDAPTAGTIYIPWPDLPATLGHLVVRTKGDPAVMTAALSRILRESDPTLPAPQAHLLESDVLESIADRRLRVVPAVSFAVLALGVALVGLCATMMRAVAERRRELAIRGALGASPTRTVLIVLGEGTRVTVAGVIAGLAASAAIGKLMAGLLYGVAPRDPVTFATVGLLVTAAAIGVCYLAARRALRVNLVDLLHAE